MKKLQLLLLAMAAINSHAQEAAIYTGTLDCYRSVETGERSEMRMPMLKCVTNNPQKADSEDDDEVVYLDVTVTAPGELVDRMIDKIGNDFSQLDSLVVRGPIGSDDFITMWNATFFGRLSVINLQHAQIERGLIPDDAFFNITEQLFPSEGNMRCINLRRIMLPENVTFIGQFAFGYAINLEQINIPASLEQIGSCAFCNCSKLRFKDNKLVFPEGFKRIGDDAFFECKAMEGDVIFPSTLRVIAEAAFYRTKISSVTIPEGLERLGRWGFYECKLKTVKLPNSCQIIDQDAFRWNLELESATLPDGLGSIPAGTFFFCQKLQEVNIPPSVSEIGESAFGWCESFKTLVFPKNLSSIGPKAFTNMTSLEKIYCPATLPPACGVSPEGHFPFEGTTPVETTVYVPIGCADKYRNAKGWDYFTNFIETDQFPGQASVTETLIDNAPDSGILYDLMGRRVENPVKGQIYIKNGKKLIHNK